MTPPSVLVNTLVSGTEKPFIDVVSKIFIICGLPFGIIRLPLLGDINVVITLLLVIYSLCLMFYYFSVAYATLETYLLNLVIGLSCLQSVFLIIYNPVSIKRLQRYYNELNVFDKEVGCRAKIGQGTIRNMIVTVVTMIYFVFLFALSDKLSYLDPLDFNLLSFILCHVFDVHYYAHLLSLFLPRVRIINYYMELSLSNCKITKPPNVQDFGLLKAYSNESHCKIENVMNLYRIMIKAYNNLMEAVKWQLMLAIIVTFINILTASYRTSLTMIKEDVSLPFMFTYVGVSVGVLSPLIAPCILGDLVHNEVHRLRELLVSRLYENQLDKSGRGVARALLAWTETRDLSFSLLRMLDIDISLPFKFVGLLVTYLIILLQFQKVINP